MRSPERGGLAPRPPARSSWRAARLSPTAAPGNRGWPTAPSGRGRRSTVSTPTSRFATCSSQLAPAKRRALHGTGWTAVEVRSSGQSSHLPRRRCSRGSRAIFSAADPGVSTAWAIATETESTLKEGNYLQGTILMVLRKRFGLRSRRGDTQRGGAAWLYCAAPELSLLKERESRRL